SPLLFLLLPIVLPAQKRRRELADIHRWKKIEAQQITPDGQWVAYQLSPATEGDHQLCLWNARTAATTRFERAEAPQFSSDGQYLVFKITPPLDTLKAQRRRKVKKEELPADTLAVLHLGSGAVQKFPELRSFALPEKWSGWLAYQLEPAKPEKPKKDEAAAEPDSTKTPATAEKKEPKAKKEDTKENGSRLVLYELASGRADTVPFVLDYRFAKRGASLLLHSTGRDSAFPAGVYRFDCVKGQLQPLIQGEKTKFAQLALDEWGRQAVFLVDTDTSKTRIRPWQLHYWSEQAPGETRQLADTASAFLQLPEGRWGLSEHQRPEFSANGSQLYFGRTPPPVLPDTTLLPEEIVEVEVWAWNNNRLYTELEDRLAADRKRSYPVVFHVKENKFVPLGGPELPDWRFQQERNARWALAISEEPYAQYRQWEGEPPRDVYAVNLATGERHQLVQGLRCAAQLSPEARYVLWWSDPDTAWFCSRNTDHRTVRLTDNRHVRFFNEDSDVPDFPGPYGLAGWLPADSALLLYDRYDLWKFDPEGQMPPQRLTQGREHRTVGRYLRLDPDATAIDPRQPLLLHQFNEEDKTEGYAWLDLKSGKTSAWMNGPYSYTRRPLKAEKADKLLFTRENFNVFPDLLLADLTNPAKPATLRISNANPQQTEYRWGSIELTRWTSLSGQPLEGLLVKPAGFDPKKQYPMLVYFYEKLSDGLHQHRAPDFHRSAINFSLYASRGYLVFAPDIPYKTGYPGESAYDAIMSGVTALINQGFVDPKRVGLQGHSWGGYQSAYLITRTNLFACAESGAPVVNMTSAYGGIRWGSGLSRQFQYERTQSRIGGSLWDYPLRFLENSPLFSMDKVQTPVLILHNDEDGAVPWYQGIEMFTALRRLGKPAWMLNYNGEPHWPVKLQNRIDFQTRMLQFFDHYLLDAPLPRWMERGVPPLEKGILQGLEPVDAGRH
ncbi:MAG: S9 family peptidase, partial [Saprospiraceae bacterium]|nr:S9 family peptidase [Saprospiraceae bacterium]